MRRKMTPGVYPGAASWGPGICPSSGSRAVPSTPRNNRHHDDNVHLSSLCAGHCVQGWLWVSIFTHSLRKTLF